jgi:hypothetical protein
MITSWVVIRGVWNSFEAGGVDKCCKSQFMNYLKTAPSNKTSSAAILDPGATDNFLDVDAPYVNKQISVTPMEVKLPNGDFIRSTHTTTI